MMVMQLTVHFFFLLTVSFFPPYLTSTSDAFSPTQQAIESLSSGMDLSGAKWWAVPTTSPIIRGQVFTRHGQTSSDCWVPFVIQQQPTHAVNILFSLYTHVGWLAKSLYVFHYRNLKCGQRIVTRLTAIRFKITFQDTHLSAQKVIGWMLVAIAVHRPMMADIVRMAFHALRFHV